MFKTSWGVAPVQTLPAVDIGKLDAWNTVLVGKHSVNEHSFYLGMSTC